jgi:hypothetical protein
MAESPGEVGWFTVSSSGNDWRSPEPGALHLIVKYFKDQSGCRQESISREIPRAVSLTRPPAKHSMLSRVCMDNYPEDRRQLMDHECHRQSNLLPPAISLPY